MKIVEENLNGIIVFEPEVFEDLRGYFFELFNEEKFNKYIGKQKFVQDNISFSVKNTIRGLHYQYGEFAQGKLCHVLSGSIIDITLDLRKTSPTFGRHYSYKLNDKNKRIIWIPPGFAHGFSVISDEAIFYYKCTNFYNSAAEKTILYSDTDLNIDWKVLKPVVSVKDSSAPQLKSIPDNFLF